MQEPTPFTNSQLTVDDLPSLQDIDWVTMDRRLIIRDVLRNSFVCIFLFVPFVVIALVTMPLEAALLRLIGIVVLCAGILIIFVLLLWPRLEYPHRGYALRELDLVERRGLLTKYLGTVPFSRVQHVSVSQGVLDRMLNLATLQIYTAGGVSTIRGFSREDAHVLREHILERVAEINAATVEENPVYNDSDALKED